MFYFTKETRLILLLLSVAQLGNFAGVALIFFSALVTNTGDADSKIWARDWDFYVAVSAPCILGLVIANVIAKVYDLRPPERV